MKDNMKRKKLVVHKLVLYAVLCLVMFLGLSVFAHPGRTDKNGGHWDRKAGTYHFHTGEYAGKNSGGSSSKPTPSPFETPYEPPTENPYQTAQPKSNNITTVLSSIVTPVFALMMVYFIPLAISAVIATVRSFSAVSLLPGRKIKSLNDKLDNFFLNREQIAILNTKIADLNKRCTIPDAYEIGKDNLPKEKKRISGWGKSLTLYRTVHGTKLHAKYKCCSATKPVNICWYKDVPNLSAYLCKMCAMNYKIPDLSWYDYCLELEQAQKRKQNLEASCKQLKQDIEVLHKQCNSTKTKILIVFSKRNKQLLTELNKRCNDVLQKE
jgi:hypothetical protein